MNSLNKTEAAIFPCRPCFPFFQIIYIIGCIFIFCMNKMRFKCYSGVTPVHVFTDVPILAQVGHLGLHKFLHPSRHPHRNHADVAESQTTQACNMVYGQTLLWLFSRWHNSVKLKINLHEKCFLHVVYMCKVLS